MALGGIQFLPAQTLSESEILNQAGARIQKYRTGNAQLRLVTADGKALKKGTHVSIEQTRHSFLFGSNIFMLFKCKSDADNAAYEKEFSDCSTMPPCPFTGGFTNASRGIPTTRAPTGWPPGARLITSP